MADDKTAERAAEDDIWDAPWDEAWWMLTGRREPWGGCADRDAVLAMHERLAEHDARIQAEQTRALTREQIEQTVYRVLYEHEVSFVSAVVIPAISAALLAQGDVQASAPILDTSEGTAKPVDISEAAIRADQRERDAQIAEAATPWSIMGDPAFDQKRVVNTSIATERARIAAAIREGNNHA